MQPAVLFLAALGVALGGAWPTLAQESNPQFPAVTPEVQTAEWAKNWWMPRHEQKLAEKKDMGQVDLVMIGDSITHGWEGAGKEVWDKYYASRKTLNLGFSGDRTEQVLWRLDHGAMEGITPKLAVIMIGTNNTGHRQDPAEQTAAGVQAIVERVSKLTPETKVLLLAIFPRAAQADAAPRKLNDAINEKIKAMADGEKVFYLDINKSFLDDQGNLPADVMPDLLHPNAEGYQRWAEAMEPTIKKLMGE